MTSLTIRRSALAARLAVLVLAALATALVPHPGSGTIGLAALGAVAAVVAPARVGAIVLMLAEVVGWAVAYGDHGAPAPLRAVAFAIALYLVHAATALAASAPVSADLAPGVARGWAVRCLPGVAAAAVAGLVVAVIGHPGGSPALDLAGLGATVVTVGAIVWAARNLDGRDAS